MMIASLLLALGLTAAPAVTSESAAPVVASARYGLPGALAAVVTDGDQGVGRGVKNILIGAAIAGVGLGIATVATLTFLAGFIGYAVFSTVLPFAALPAVTAGMFVGGVLGIGATSLLAVGLLWTAVNTMLVIARLDPEFKPGPATEYLDR